MRRFFIEEIIERDGLCTVSGTEARHITKVLRMIQGDRFILMDGKGKVFEARIGALSPKEVIVNLEKKIPPPKPSPVYITLCQALLKSGPMDYMIQKTSELGVNLILPFMSERTVVKFDRDRAVNKMKHWQNILQSAAKQSGRGQPADISPPQRFHETVSRFKCEEALKVIFWEEESSTGLKGLLKTSSPAREFVGIVGPEGGLTGKEVEAARDAGFISVSFGSRILRAETAAIAIASIVQYEWGDLEPVS